MDWLSVVARQGTAEEARAAMRTESQRARALMEFYKPALNCWRREAPGVDKSLDEMEVFFAMAD